MKKTIFFGGAFFLLSQGLPFVAMHAAAAENDETRKCGPACTYKKANETAAVQALYILYKVQLVEDCQSGDTYDDCVRSNLGSFCIGNEDGDKCFSRYKPIALQDLRRLRNAISRNETQALQLKTEGANYVAATADEVEKKTPITPNLPDLKTLNERYQRDQQSAAAMRGTLNYRQAYLDVAQPPSRSDFVKFKKIPRNPDKPGGEQMEVEATDCTGPRPCIDEEAYKKALAEYARINPKADIEKIDKNEVLKRPIRLDDEKNIGLESTVAYEEAQQAAVISANKKITGGDQVIAISKPSKDKKEERKPVKLTKPKAGSDDVYVKLKLETLDAGIKNLMESQK